MASKDGQERCPARVLEGRSERVVLDQVGDPQVFVRDGVVRVHQLARCFVVEVAARAGDVLLRLGQERYRVEAAVTPLLAPRHPPLAAPQIGFRPAGTAGGEDPCAIRQCSEGLQPQVDPRVLARGRPRLQRHVGAGNGDTPPIRFLGDDESLGCPLDRTGPMHTLMRPILERTSLPLSRRAPLPYSLKVKE